MSGLEDLRVLSDRLAALLADPHPGLMGWKLELGKTLLHLAAYCGIEPVCDEAAFLIQKSEYTL